MRMRYGFPTLPQARVADLTFTVSVGIIVLGRQHSTLSGYLGVITDTVDDAAEVLGHDEVLGQLPLEDVGLLGRIVERDDC